MTSSSVNESIWNVMGIYRDKTVHYKYYDTLYQMGYLDWNENRERKIRYSYSTEVRDWKIRHPKRTKRTILKDKSYKWQEETLRRVFPNRKVWFDNCIYSPNKHISNFQAKTITAKHHANDRIAIQPKYLRLSPSRDLIFRSKSISMKQTIHPKCSEEVYF